MAHEPVLLHEVIDGLGLKPGQTVVDATLDGGGHGEALGAVLGPTGRLIGIDEDQTMLDQAKKRLADCPAPATLIRGNFRKLDRLLAKSGVESVDAILFDLGWSTEQLENSGRGFSFRRAEPLIMTLAEPTAGRLTAADLVNTLSTEALAKIIAVYGEDRQARRIAAAIVAARLERPITTSDQLATIIARAVRRRGRRHPATKTFQALRIATNDELDALREGLDAAWRKLAAGGRLAVISFHSLEARIVKDFFQTKKRAGGGEILTKKAIKPTRRELIENRRAKSAQLRIIKKL